MTIRQLIDLAENGTLDEQEYYGRVLPVVLVQFVEVAKDNGDGTISIYWADGSAWRKSRSASAEWSVPARELIYIKPANRGEDFPPEVPYEEFPVD